MATEKKSTSKKSTKTTDSKAKTKKTIEAEVVNDKGGSSSINVDNKTLIVLAHILGIVTSFVAPLVVLLISEDSLVKKHATAALNFQISIIIYGLVLTIGGGILTAITFGLFGLILVPLYFVFGVFAVVPPILATVKANEDQKKV